MLKRGLEITPSEMLAFGRAMQGNKTVTSIMINKSNLSDEHIKKFMEGLFLEDNNLKGLGLKDTNLETLDFCEFIFGFSFLPFGFSRPAPYLATKLTAPVIPDATYVSCVRPYLQRETRSETPELKQSARIFQDPSSRRSILVRSVFGAKAERPVRL